MHVGDTEVDRAMAEQAGFEFLDSLVDAEARLLDGMRGD
jgi:hypothetical protein